MKKLILSLCVAAVVAAGVFGLLAYRKATPSSADHRLVSLVSGGEAVTSVTLNLRLLKSARSVESLKAKVEAGEKYLLWAVDLPPRHRDLFLETFSSLASGSMKTAKGTSPFRVFASHGSADEALEVLKAAHLVEAASTEEYVLIHPETCEREGPLRLVKGERVLAFVPAELAEGVSARLAQKPGQEMDSLVIARAGINVRPYLEELAHPLMQMAAEQLTLAENARSLELSLRADTGGGLWAELDVATDQQQQLQEFWVKRTGGDAPLWPAVSQTVKLTPGKEGLRLTLDVNALQKHGEDLVQELYPAKKPTLLTEEDLKAITEEVLAEAQNVFSYDEALTPESFFALSGEECEASDGMPLGDTKKLSLGFESLSAHPKLPGTDFISLSAQACLPPQYAPLLGKQPMLEVAIGSPKLGRTFCGPVAAEADGMASEEKYESSYNGRHWAKSEVKFALEPGVDAQKLAALEGSVTVQLPTRVKKVKLAFAPPYGRTELAVPGGSLSVEGTGADAEGLAFQLSGEGVHPTVLAVRALNADGKYLETKAERWARGGASFFDLPFEKLLPGSKRRAFVALGKPAQLEVVLVEASSPLTQPFTFKPPFPAGPPPEDEDPRGEPPPVSVFTQATYEEAFLAPDFVARLEEEFTEFLESTPGHVRNGIRTDSPFKLTLRTEGVFQDNLTILWADEVGGAFGQLDTPFELEIQEVDFVDGTRLRSADMEAVEEVDSEKRYVWGDRFGRQTAWRTSHSLRHTNGSSNSFTLMLFDDYVPARMEDVPVARVKGQLSFSLPESIVMSSPAPLSLHAGIEAGEVRFRVTSIEDDSVTVLGDNASKTGFSARFTGASGWRADTSLRKRTDFKDGTFQLEFETRGQMSQWQMLQAQGGYKTYTYPFEVVAYELKPASRQVRR